MDITRKPAATSKTENDRSTIFLQRRIRRHSTLLPSLPTSCHCKVLLLSLPVTSTSEALLPRIFNPLTDISLQKQLPLLHVHICTHTYPDFGCHLPHFHIHKINFLFCPSNHKAYRPLSCRHQVRHYSKC